MNIIIHSMDNMAITLLNMDITPLSMAITLLNMDTNLLNMVITLLNTDTILLHMDIIPLNMDMDTSIKLDISSGRFKFDWTILSL